MAIADARSEPVRIDGDEPEYELLVDHGVEFVRIPGGTFLMGSPQNEGNPDERPQHEVTLDGFYMARTPVTNAHWALPCRSSGKARTDTR